MRNVFISHASVDNPRIEAIKQELRQRGIVRPEDHFIDPLHAITAGTNWRDTLHRAIAEASLVVVLWSPEASASANVNYETAMADALNKPIVLVVREGEQSRPPVDAADLKVVEMSPAG
jgi:hypothetical protein